MKEVYFSIIMHVYNAEEYLWQYVDGVYNQTYDNYELILNDDGLTDASQATEEYVISQVLEVMC